MMTKGEREGERERGGTELEERDKARVREFLERGICDTGYTTVSV